MREVPDAAGPILQIHVAQFRAGTQQQFHGPAVQARGRLGRAGGFGQQGRFGAVFEDNQRVPEIARAGSEHREHVQRFVDRHAAGHVQQRAAGPGGGVQGREFIGSHVERAKQMRANQIAVLFDELIEAAEEHAPLAPLFVQAGRVRAAIDGRDLPAQLNAVRQQRVNRGRGGCLGGKSELIPAKQPDVGPHPFFVALAGGRQRFELPPGLLAQVSQPGRLAARLLECVECLATKTQACDRFGH